MLHFSSMYVPVQKGGVRSMSLSPPWTDLALVVKSCDLIEFMR